MSIFYAEKNDQTMHIMPFDRQVPRNYFLSIYDQMSCYHLLIIEFATHKAKKMYFKKAKSCNLQPQKARIKPSLSQKSRTGVRIRHGTYTPVLSLICYLFVKSSIVLGLCGPNRSVALFVEGHSGSP